jgi:hypothetical protein
MGFKEWADANKRGSEKDLARRAKSAEDKAARVAVKEAARAEWDAGAPARAAAKRDAHLAQLDQKAARVDKPLRAMQEKTAREAGKAASFEGVTLKLGQVRYKGTGGAVKGATARVESASDVRRRITATRLVACLPLALIAKKQVGHVFLTVEAPGFEFVAEVPVKKEAEARGFAAKINNAAKV